MKHVLTVYIECGEVTCYDFDSKKMCSHVLTTHFGTRWACGLFRKSSPTHGVINTPLKEDDHQCLLRCQQCLNNTQRIKE